MVKPRLPLPGSRSASKQVGPFVKQIAPWRARYVLAKWQVSFRRKLTGPNCMEAIWTRFPGLARLTARGLPSGSRLRPLPIGARRYMQKVEIRVFCTKCVIIGLDPIICLKRFPGQARE